MKKTYRPLLLALPFAVWACGPSKSSSKFEVVGVDGHWLADSVVATSDETQDLSKTPEQSYLVTFTDRSVQSYALNGSQFLCDEKQTYSVKGDQLSAEAIADKSCERLTAKFVRDGANHLVLRDIKAGSDVVAKEIRFHRISAAESIKYYAKFAVNWQKQNPDQDDNTSVPAGPDGTIAPTTSSTGSQDDPSGEPAEYAVKDFSGFWLMTDALIQGVKKTISTDKNVFVMHFADSKYIQYNYPDSRDHSTADAQVPYLIEGKKIVLKQTTLPNGQKTLEQSITVHELSSDRMVTDGKMITDVTVEKLFFKKISSEEAETLLKDSEKFKSHYPDGIEE